VKILLISLFLSGCESKGPQTNPFIREAQWFSYVNGDDIRKKCYEGGTSYYRLVYNGQYLEQVRTYDISQGDGEDYGLQQTHVFARGVGASARIENGSVTLDAENRSEEEINYAHLVDIDQALISAGFETPAPEGLLLHSDDFYWVAMVCRDGKFKFHAWSEQNTKISLLPFEKVMASGDATNIPFLSADTPKYPGRGSRHLAASQGNNNYYFSMQVGKNGLRL
jgi:hypothetical protein